MMLLECWSSCEFSKSPATVDHQRLAGGEGGLIRCEIQCQFRDLFSPAKSAHRLAREESGAGAFRIAVGGDALPQRWSFNRAGADCVAANPFCYGIDRDRLGEPDDGCLGRAVNKRI